MGDNVTEIGFFAFNGCYALSSVILGTGITELNNGIFMESGLREFSIPEGITAIKPYAFQGCEYLTQVVIPETVTEIGEYAFAYCVSLTAADIPASVTYVGEYAFYQCDMLSQVTVPESVTTIGEFAFADCTELTTVIIPDSVEFIGAYAFIGCTNLTELTIGKNVTAIGDSAFEGCVALTEVSVPEGVTEFVYRLFAGCTSLEKIDIPQSVQSIGDMTFADCNTLTEITVPDSVETIGDYAFKQCENLSVVNIGKSVSQIGYNPFYECGQLTAIRVHEDNKFYSSDNYGALYENENYLLRVPAMLSGEFVIRDGAEEFDMDAFRGCTELTSITVPGSVKVIPEAAFEDCYNLQSVTLNEGVEYVNNMAFAFCSALEEIVFPSTVTYIGGECFIDCHALRSVTLPEGLSVIEPYTFAWCYGLETVTIPASVNIIYDNAFAGCNELKEVIYSGRMSDWMLIQIWSGNEVLQNAVITFAGDNEMLDSGSCGENVYWSLTVGGKLSVFGTGDMYDYGLYEGTAPWAAYASDIRSVEIQEGVTRVGDNAFENCENLTLVTVAGSVMELGNRCFFGCANLCSVTLNDGLLSIGRNAFAECRSLVELVLPNTVEFLGETMFAYTSLKELYIPASVTTIDGDIFHNCEKLETILVDEANANYASDERGVLYNKEMTELLRAPCALNGTYVVPKGVESIAAYAFFLCRNLNEIHLPESLKTVADYAFYCCDNLWNVYHPGSESDWEQVSIGSENNALLNANIYFGRESNLGEGVCGDNLTWVLDTNGSLVISGTGAMYDYEGLGPWWQLHDWIQSVFVEDGVTSIGSYAFRGCYSLSYVQLADTVETIGGYAFFDCDCLTEFSMPSALTTIGQSAFYDCDSLQTVYNNSSLTAVYSCAFKGCDNLTTFWFTEGLTTLGEEAFMNTCLTSVILPNTMQTVGDRVFAGSMLKEATVEDSELTALGNGFFENCTELQSANLGNSLVVLGIDAFNGCTALSSVLLSGSLASMGERCFKNCRSLQSISIPDGITRIYNETFYACENLIVAYLGSNVESIGDYAFYGTGVQELNAGDGLRTIGTGAFSNCQSLTTVTGIDKVTEIGSSAFADCYSLYSFTIPAGVTYIGHYTFSNCYELRTLYMSNLVSGIGYNAFEGCYNLVDVYFDGSKIQFEAIHNEGGNEMLYNANLNCTQAPENVYYCEHCGQEVEWQDWDGIAANGHFRLTNDYYGKQVMVGSATTDGVHTVLDLRGYTLYSEKRAFTVYSGNQLSVLDSVGGGVIAGGATSTIGGAVLISGGSFYLYSGTLTSQTTNSGGCVYVSNHGYFHMNGGQLMGAALNNGRRGGALYVAENTSANLAGGLITDGFARGASIYAANNCSLHLGDVTVGEILTASSANVMLYNSPVVAAMDLTSGAKLFLDNLGWETSVTVYADDVFTNYTEYAEQLCQYFVSGFEHSVISAVDGTLKVSYPNEQEVVDVTVMEMPHKWQYEQGEMLDITGLQLLVYYSDGYEEVVEDGFEWYGFESETPGIKTVYVTYGDYETCFDVTVNQKRVTNVYLHAYPLKTEYYIGEELDLSGLELQVIYSNGDEDFIADGYTFSCEPFDAEGANSVEISYADFKINFNVTVKVKETEITLQPVDVTADSGTAVSFTVGVEGEVAAYQWQYNKGDDQWFDTAMNGYNTDTLTVTATGARNGYEYRCVITFADGTELISEPAELTVKTYITNIQNPNDQVVVLGYKGQFTASATGEGLKYQWEYKRPDVERWIETAMEGANKPTVYIESTKARDGYQYRCRITDDTGVVAFTEPATMRVLSFVSHPVETFAASGSKVKLTVSASVSEGFTYQWQYRRNATDSWHDTTMTGCKTDTLTVDAKLSRNGYQYRCVLTGSKNTQIGSKAATLHVGDPVVITAQPQSVTAASSESVQFTVDATNVYAYQWYYSKTNGQKWSTTTAEGNQTATLTIAAKGKNGYQYCCYVYGLDGTVTITEVATLTVG